MDDNVLVMSCDSLLEALRIGIKIAGGSTEMRVGGDFGQDEGAGDLGIGNDSFSVVAHANGRATLCVDPDAVWEYFRREAQHG